jgi:hypothetical protein
VRSAPPIAEETLAAEPGPALSAPAAWDGYLATICVHRPELAQRLVEEFGLDVPTIQHPVARRMIEVALATPGGEAFPLSSLAPHERDFAAALLVQTVPELLPESRVHDLDTAIADSVQRVVEWPLVTELRDLNRQIAEAKDRGDSAEVDRLAARRRALATQSPKLRRTARTG